MDSVAALITDQASNRRQAGTRLPVRLAAPSSSALERIRSGDESERRTAGEAIRWAQVISWAIEDGPAGDRLLWLGIGPAW